VIEIRTGTKKRIEEILKDYPNMDKYINDRKQELMYPIQAVDENVGGGKSSKVSRPQELYVVTLDQDMRLRMLERQKSVVNDCYLAADKDTKTIIDELYFKKNPVYTISGLSVQHKINVSIATAKRMRTKFLSELAVKLGMYEP